MLRVAPQLVRLVIFSYPSRQLYSVIYGIAHWVGDAPPYPLSQGRYGEHIHPGSHARSVELCEQLAWSGLPTVEEPSAWGAGRAPEWNAAWLALLPPIAGSDSSVFHVPHLASAHPWLVPLHRLATRSKARAAPLSDKHIIQPLLRFSHACWSVCPGLVVSHGSGSQEAIIT